MRLRVEISPETAEEEVVIRCRERDARTVSLERAVESIIGCSTDMMLTLGDTEYYIPKKELLFFETYDGKVTAHTADRMLYTSYKLFELESIMPKSFVRVSKSCIVNIDAIGAIAKNLTGASRVMFRGTEKAVYVSRSYYKVLKEKIEALRFFAE